MLDYLTAGEWFIVALIALFVFGVGKLPAVADRLAGVERER